MRLIPSPLWGMRSARSVRGGTTGSTTFTGPLGTAAKELRNPACRSTIAANRERGQRGTCPALAPEPWRPPGGIGRGDRPNQRPDVLGDRRPARAPPAEAGPVLPKPSALLGEHGGRLYKYQDLSPSGPAPRQPRPENPIARPHVQPSGRSLLHPELMPERSDLQMQGRTRPDQSNRKCAPGTQDGRHNVGILTSTRGLLKADSVMQIVGKINRDADHEYSGTTGSLDALPRPC